MREQLKSYGIVDTKELDQHIAYYMDNLELPDSLEQKLKDIYHSNYVLMQYGMKQYNLAPQYTTRAKYITIDTDVLHSLVKSNISKALFGNNQIGYWQQFTNIKPKYLQANKKFNMMVKTDGVGCSVVIFRDNTYNKTASSEAVRKKRKLDARQGFLDNLPEDVKWVGVDPGRRDLLSAGWEDGRRFNVSNGSYYTQCKYRKRQAHTTRKIEELCLSEFMGNMPSSKTDRSTQTMAYLNYLFEHQNKLQELFDLQCTRNIRQHRWKAYIHTQKTLDRICHRLTKDHPNSVIAYGDSSFSHNSKGYAPTLKANRIKHRLEKVHGTRVLMVNEFNTSQVCSLCQHPSKLVSLKSNRDPAAARVPVVPVKPHFVRRCTHCLMIWNSDTNAWRNMIYLAKEEHAGRERPEIFRIGLANPPVLENE